jgi:hypothetical protein
VKAWETGSSIFLLIVGAGAWSVDAYLNQRIGTRPHRVTDQ